MDWTGGWPVTSAGGGVTWQLAPVVGGSGTRTLTRETLHRASRSWSQLTRSVPADLVDRTLEEGKAWRKRLPELLDLLKPSVHDGEAPPADTLASPAWTRRAVTTLRAEIAGYPALADDLRRATWVWFLRPNALRRIVAALPQLAQPLVAFLDRVEDRERWAQRLLALGALLSTSQAVEVVAFLAAVRRSDVPEHPDHGRRRAAIRQALGRGEDAVTIPAAQPPDVFAGVARWAETWTASRLERRLRLWTTVFPLDQLQTTHGWLSELDQLAEHALRWRRGRRRQASQRGLATLDDLERRRPRTAAVLPLLERVDVAAQLPDGAAADLEALLELARRHEDPRLTAVLFADLLHPWLSDAPGRLRTLRRWFRRAADPQSLLPLWQSRTMVHDLPAPMRLQQVVFSDGVRRPILEVLLRLADAGVDLTDVAWVFTAATAASLWPVPVAAGVTDVVVPLNLPVSRALAVLTPDGRRVAALARRLASHDDQPLVQLARDVPGLADLVLATEDLPRLLRIGRLWTLARPHRELAQLASDDAWVAEWPDELAEALRALCPLFEDPQGVAARAVRQRYRPRVVLEAELAWVRAHPGTAPNREATLVRKLASPPDPSVIRWMLRRLERARVRGQLDQLERTLAPAWAAVCEQRLGVAPDELPLPQDTRDRLLVALLRLPRASRRLAARVLQRRLRSDRWDLHDDPANAEWIGRSRLRLEPWLSPGPPVEIMAPDGTELTIGIETDPLELVWMGNHFQTWLSLGSFNFFSVLSNIADANKQVVYVRGESGEVVGRCLLAIDRADRLLCFDTYAHDEGLCLPEIVDAFVLDLARAMGAVTASHGVVATLASHAWYDDGARAVGVPDALAEGSRLRRLLAHAPPTEVDAALDRLLGPQFRTQALQTLLQLPCVAARPELVHHWLDLLLDSHPDDTAWVIALEVLYADDRLDAVRQLVRGRLKLWARGRVVRNGGAGLWEPAVEAATTTTIRVLRSMPDDPWRAYWLGRGFEQLGRTSAARERYRAAMVAFVPVSIREDASRRLRRLGG